MRRIAFLLSMVLLAFSGSAKADGVGMSYATVSLNSIQIEIEGLSLPVVPSPCLIPTTIGVPSAAMLLGTTPSLCIPLNPCLGLLGGASLQPTPTPSLIGAQASMALAAVRHDVAMAVIRNMR